MSRAPRTPLEGGDNSCTLDHPIAQGVTYFDVRMSDTTRQLTSPDSNSRALRSTRPDNNAGLNASRAVSRSTNPETARLGYHHSPTSPCGDLVRISYNCAESQLRPISSQHERREPIPLIHRGVHAPKRL